VKNIDSNRLVHKTIASLQQRLQDNGNLLRLQLSEGYITDAICRFNPPALKEDLDHFMTELGYQLPEDYYEFLLIANGCRLFDHPEYGGENYLYRWQDINEFTYEEPSEGYLKIGYFYQDNLVIDLKLSQAGNKDYLLIKGHIDQFEESKSLKMNFEVWLDRFVVSQGSKFWEW
jgi:hypothetical protein